ncbi:unnamed protein product [Ilex paraguariensis]|uniref:AB hydrolase-1 domain-containing protein n=1 Tax=Ilex paraguariensis TaxID=185542 RepID=A0ABC8QNZ2_9AQUA
MVNVFTVVKPLLQGLMKLVGMTPKLVEIEPRTLMNFWVPNETIQRNQNQNQNHTAWDIFYNKPSRILPHTNHKTNKPAVVFVHGFVGDGIITWLFQVLALTGRYAVYVPDLLFFGGSTTDSHHRSTTFQAECLAKGLRKLGVESCTLKIGFSRWSEFLLPETVEGVKVMLTVGTHRVPWLPDFLFRNFWRCLLFLAP